MLFHSFLLPKAKILEYTNLFKYSILWNFLKKVFIIIFSFFPYDLQFQFLNFFLNTKFFIIILVNLNTFYIPFKIGLFLISILTQIIFAFQAIIFYILHVKVFTKLHFIALIIIIILNVNDNSFLNHYVSLNLN